MGRNDTSVGKGIFKTILGTVSTVAIGFGIYRLFEGVGAAEAAAIAGEAQAHAMNLIAQTALVAVNGAFALFSFEDALHNFKEELVF